MAITNLSTDWGVDPRIIRIVTTDDLAEITTPGYVTSEADNIELIQNGTFEWVSTDEVLISYADGQGFFTYDADTSAFVATPSSPGTLSSTLVQNHVFVGSALNVATDVAMSGDVHIVANGATTIQAGVVSSSKLAANTIQYAKVAMTAAQWNGMYGAPFLLVAAPAAGSMIVVQRAVLAMTYVAAQYAVGGVVALQYDSTAHGAGPLASATLAAATVNAYAVSSDAGLAGADTSGASVAKVAKGLYISNDTAAFTTGDGTWEIHVWYEVVVL